MNNKEQFVFTRGGEILFLNKRSKFKVVEKARCGNPNDIIESIPDEEKFARIRGGMPENALLFRNSKTKYLMTEYTIGMYWKDGIIISIKDTQRKKIILPAKPPLITNKKKACLTIQRFRKRKTIE